MMPPIINQPLRAHLWQLWNSSLLLMLFPWTHLKSSSPWKAPSKITRTIFITIFFDNNHADNQIHHNHGQFLHVHHQHDQRQHHDLLFPDLPQTAWRSNYGETPRRWRRACLLPRWSWWCQGDHDGTKVVVIEDVSHLMSKRNQSPYSWQLLINLCVLVLCKGFNTF